MDEKEILEELKTRCTDPGTLSLIDALVSARKDAYKRICVAIDNEICGDIFQIQHGRSKSVVAVGTDAIKNIVFREMGFGPADALEMN